MTDGMLLTVAAGAWLILFALFVGLALRFRTLRGEADLLFAAGALDADQAMALRGDVARRRAVSRIVCAQRDAAMSALALALDELAGAKAEAARLGEALDHALADDAVGGRR